METAISIVLVQPCGRLRMQLAAAICAERRLLLAESVACGHRALERIALVRPDVVLVDASLEEPRSAEFIRAVRAGANPPEVVLAVRAGNEPAAVDWLADGAAGCVPASCSGAELAASLLQLRSGESPILPGIARLLVERLRAAPRAVESRTRARGAVSAREADVLRLLAAGRSYQRVSAELGISLHTVSTHIKSAYRKLEVHSAGAAVMRAVQLRLIEA